MEYPENKSKLHTFQSKENNTVLFPTEDYAASNQNLRKKNKELEEEIQRIKSIIREVSLTRMKANFGFQP